MRTASEVVDVKVGGETITATVEHPFWVEGKGWTAARELERGTRLVRRDGSPVAVESVKHRQGTFQIYNLEVSGIHSYYVSRLGILVHNQSATPPGSGKAPNFLGQENGPAIPVPDGATGPTPTANGKGFAYTGGKGGNGLDSRVENMRVMDPTKPSGPSPGYPNGYVNYSNKGGQAVNPYTGKTVAKSDPWWHIPRR